MELILWRSFGKLSSLRREMDDLWKRFFGRTPTIGTFAEEWLPFKGMLPLLSYTIRDSMLIKVFNLVFVLTVGGILFATGI